MPRASESPSVLVPACACCWAAPGKNPTAGLGATRGGAQDGRQACARPERARERIMDVRAHIEQNAPAFFGSLKQWLAIPSISADPAHHGDVRRSAQWLAEHLRETGFPVSEGWGAGTEGASGRGLGPSRRAARGAAGGGGLAAVRACRARRPAAGPRRLR